MHNINAEIVYFLQSVTGMWHWLDRFVVTLTSYAVQWAVFGLTLFYVYVSVPAARQPFDRLARLARLLEGVFSMVVLWFVVTVLKIVTAVPRPFEVLPNIVQLVYEVSGQSFPSGHAAMALGLATIIYIHHQRLGIALYIFAFLVGISRIYVGVHYPIGVVFGFALGYTVPTLIHKGFWRTPRPLL